MKAFTLRLPDDLHERLAVSATTNGRSMQQEAIRRIGESLERTTLPESARAPEPGGRVDLGRRDVTPLPRPTSEKPAGRGRR